MHANSLLLFEKYARPLIFSGARVLEIGPDGFPSSFQKATKAGNLTWDTLDIYAAPELTYPSSPLYEFAIPSDTYDIVFSAQVIEHVAQVWDWMREVARVAKPGGLVITINPVSWPYHQAPLDCWRIYPDGMKALCKFAGLEMEQSVFESLETPHFKKALPGRSSEWQTPAMRWAFRVMGSLGFPVEKAFDTVTIARKPAAIVSAREAS